MPCSSAEMAGVVAVSEFIKEHEEMKGQLYWGQPQVIHLMTSLSQMLKYHLACIPSTTLQMSMAMLMLSSSK